MPDALSEYQSAFAAVVGVDHAFTFWKGRVALYAILKALGLGRGDEIIIPGYTCVMAVNPIVYLGAKPIFVDIEPETFNADPDAIEAALSPRTRAIIAQHTYGYPAPMREIIAIAERRGIPVIEDCCLANGSRYDGRPVGSFGLAAYWSGQWNKPYTTGIGGIATTRSADLASKIGQLSREEALSPGPKETLMLFAQLMIYRSIVFPRTTAMIQNVFRWLTKLGLVVGSSQSSEYTPVMEADFFKRMSGVQARSGVRQLRKLARGNIHRHEMTTLYDDLLASAGFPVVRHCEGHGGTRGTPLTSRTPPIDPVLVRYPVRVADKARALSDASRHLVELGSWFEVPLHPHETDLAAYGYTAGMCPVSEKACREVVNLPVHPRTNAKTAQRTVDYIKSIGPAA